MDLTKEHFYNTCLKLGLGIEPKSINHQNIWIGFSGGMDSRALLELTLLTFGNNKNYTLRAIHINHSINKNADLWQQHCHKICDQLGLEIHTIKVKVTSEQLKESGSLEAALRACRIQAWQKLLAPQDVLLLGHHLNDQTETVFLRLLRGSGLTGVGGIRAVSILGKIKIIRPLLSYTRQQLESFVEKYQLSYITDDSNKDLKFVRNFLRHEIFPKLINNWPTFINNIGRAANHLQEASLFIKNQAKQALVACYFHNGDNKNILLINKLLTYDSFLQAEILREFIINQGFYPPDQDKLTKIYTEVINAKVDRQPKLNLHQYVICRYRDRLYVYPANYFKREKLSFSTTVGDLEIYLGDAINKVGLSQAKKIFQKFGIPPWQRLDYPLVFRNGKLIAVIGLWGKCL